MSLTALLAKEATIIFTSFAIVVAVGMVIDALKYIAENFTDEVREVPVECHQEFPLDEFETLYVSVADGDRRDRAYWLDSVRGLIENE